MFRGLINDAKSAAGSLVTKYLARASVAVPFIAALGFAVAAVTLMLVERFGHIVAYWIVAGGFLLVGLAATLIVSVKEHEEKVAETEADKHDTAEVSTDAAAQAAVQLPIALLGALFSSPVGPGAAMGGIKLLGRNIPLVVLLVLLGMLFWPTKPDAGSDAAEAEPYRPNGMHPPAGADVHSEAA